MVREDDFTPYHLPYYQFYQEPYYMHPYELEQIDSYRQNYSPEPYMYMPYYPYPNPYIMPNNSPIQQQGDGATTNPVLQQFMDEHGQVDVSKMLKTIGQLADTVQQVTPVVKQINDIIKAFRE